MSLAEDILDSLVETYAAREADFEQWDLDALQARGRRASSRSTPRALDFSDQTADEIRDTLWEKIHGVLRGEGKARRPRGAAAGRARHHAADRRPQWKDHLYSLDHLKEGIGLRGYGQRDPLVEYKKESFALFQAMKERVDEEIVRYLWWLRPVVTDEGAASAAPAPARPTAPARRSILNEPPRQPPPAFGGRARQQRPRRRAPSARRGRSSRRASAATTPP